MATSKNAGPIKAVEVISKKDGFRRAGRSWSGTTVVPIAELSTAQLEALAAEPLLIVRETEIEPAKADA